jgi:glutamate-1-semialdehyde 2,1-aminomutase
MLATMAICDRSAPLRTLFLQEMVRNGVLMNYISPCFSHGSEEIEQTIEAAQKSLIIYSRALEDGVEKFLEGPSIKPVFRPYN